MPGKPKKPTPAQLRAARRAAEIAEAARLKRRRQLTLVIVPVVAVVVVIVALVVVKFAVGGNKPKSGQQTTTAESAVVKAVTTVPVATLNTVGIGVGTVTAAPKAIKGAALTQNGKPLVLYVGAEYCPFCAAERWGVAVALSRFGTFTNLGQTASSPSDEFPNTATLTFHGATYASSTIAFVGKELESNQVSGTSYTPLDKLTSAEQKLFDTYDAPPYVASGSKGAIPFIDIGGKYMVSGASYSPQILQGKTHAQIAAALSDPTSAIAKGIDGTANLVTAAICQSTAQKPAAVCDAPGVQAATADLTK